MERRKRKVEKRKMKKGITGRMDGYRETKSENKK